MDPENGIVSAVLIPKAPSFKQFFNLSREVENSLFYLDDNHLPHITVAQFKAPLSKANDLKSALEQLKGTNYELTTSGLNFVPSAKSNQTWVEIGVLKSDELQDLQERVLSTKFAEQFEVNYKGALGDGYRPHITIGLLKGIKTIPSISIDKHQDLLISNFEFSLTAGINGEYYSLTDI